MVSVSPDVDREGTLDFHSHWPGSDTEEDPLDATPT